VTTEKWQNLIHPDDLKQSKKMKDCFDQKVEYYRQNTDLSTKWALIWVLDKGKIISWTNEGAFINVWNTRTT
jgi:hypothetical protein